MLCHEILVVSKPVGSDDLRCLCIFAGFSNMSLMQEPGTPCSEPLQAESDLTTKMKETMAEMTTTMMASMQENIWKKLDEYIVGNEASNDSDEATDDVNISRPPHDLQTTSDVVDKYLEPPQQSQLSWEHISQEFSVAEKTGPAIDEKLAQLVTGLIPEKLPRTKLDELVEKLDNCPLLVAPKCNKAVWHQLKLPTKATDTSLQKCQKLLVAAVCALIQATTKASDDLKTPLTHSLVLALSANWQFNQKRRDILRPHLNSRYAALCNPSTSISTELFGDDIGKEIDELTKTSQIGLKLATPRKERGRYHPYNTSLRDSKIPSAFRHRDDRNQNNRVLGLQSFFGERNACRRKPGGNSGNTLTRTGPH